MLSNPENKQDLVTLLEKPWSLTQFEVYNIDEQQAKTIVPSAVTIAATLVGYGKAIMEAKEVNEATPSATHPKQLKQWAALNEALHDIKRKKARTLVQGFSTAYSYATWNIVQPIFSKGMVPYSQTKQDIPEEDFQTLMKVLSWIMKCYQSPIFSVNESKRLHSIAQAIWDVIQLFPDDIVQTEEDFDGIRVNAHGHFEFTLLRGTVRICITEVKKEDFEQGMAQDLLGCEVAADLDGSKNIYEVTNFEKWIFVKSNDESIEYDEGNPLSFDESHVPVENQLRAVVGKLHSLLLN